MTEQMAGQVAWSDVGSQFGKMFPEHFRVQEEDTQEQTSKPSSRSSSASSKQMLPMFLYLRKEDGPSPAVSWDTEMTDALFPSLGDYMTHSFGESPKEENASHLSQILEDCPHPKYSLSEKACRGILRRAEKRGKELPEVLREALENQISNPQD